MEVVSPTLYVTVQLVEHSLILHLMLTVVLVESLVHLPHWVHLVEEQPTTSGWQLCHQVDEEHTVTGDRGLLIMVGVNKLNIICFECDSA